MRETNATGPSLIITFGAGLDHKTINDPPAEWIGKESLLRAAAAAKLWKENPRAKIIFSGWRPAGPGTPSEAEVMAACIQASPWNIPKECILTENEAIDTADNVRRVVALIHHHGLPNERITFIAGRKHVFRATRYFRAYRIQVEPKLAAEVLGQDIERLGLPHVSGYRTIGDLLRESVLFVLSFVDRKGVLPTWYKRRQLRHVIA